MGVRKAELVWHSSLEPLLKNAQYVPETEKEHSIALVFITIKHHLKQVDKVEMKVTAMELLQAQGMNSEDPLSYCESLGLSGSGQLR